MISGRRSASGRLEALSPKLSGMQIGIGYYETVGDPDTERLTALTEAGDTAQRLPQVVAAPAAGSAAPLPKAKYGMFTIVGLYACAVAAAWAGKETVRYLRRTA